MSRTVSLANLGAQTLRAQRSSSDNSCHRNVALSEVYLSRTHHIFLTNSGAQNLRAQRRTERWQPLPFQRRLCKSSWHFHLFYSWLIVMSRVRDAFMYISADNPHLFNGENVRVRDAFLWEIRDSFMSRVRDVFMYISADNPHLSNGDHIRVRDAFICGVRDSFVSGVHDAFMYMSADNPHWLLTFSTATM